MHSQHHPKARHHTERWCRVNNIPIEKDSNNPTLHRLRIIHIIEANYNLAMKILWARRMMPKAEKSKLLTDSNWGSMRSRSAQDTCTMKELHNDISHLRIQDYASMENGTKSCYDRMVPSLIMHMSHSFGIRCMSGSRQDLPKNKAPHPNEKWHLRAELWILPR